MDDIIAAYKRLEQSLRTLTMIVQQADEAIAATDIDGTFQYVNEAWAKMHGYESAKELIGKNISICHTAEQMENEVAPFIEETKKRGQLVGSIGHIKKDGTPFAAEVKMTLLTNDSANALGFVWFVKDITEQKTMEKLLQQAEAQNEVSQQLIEQLQSQIAKLKRIKEELKQRTVKLQESIQTKNAELTQARKKLEQHITDQADDEQPKQQPEPFDLQRLKGLAELAKRLSQPPKEEQAE